MMTMLLHTTQKHHTTSQEASHLQLTRSVASGQWPLNRSDLSIVYSALTLLVGSSDL